MANVMQGASAQTAHTPGPWEVGRAIGPGGDYRQINAESWLELARVVYRVEGDPSAEAEANARLIAAAPDLLTACKAAEEWLSGWASAEPYLATIRAAILKAESSHG